MKKTLILVSSTLVLLLGSALPAMAFTQQVPEPSTFLLLGTGLVGLVGLGWKRKK